MSRRVVEPIEVACPTCGLIAELFRPRGTRHPKLCGCPTADRVRPVTEPRYCMTCPTKLNRYNPGPDCGACRRAREAGTLRA
jgi:hypothetical protein